MNKETIINKLVIHFLRGTLNGLATATFCKKIIIKKRGVVRAGDRGNPKKLAWQ
jgi:hypothetical protein